MKPVKSPIIKWNIVGEKAPTYKEFYNYCRLCLEKKLCILEFDERKKMKNKKCVLISSHKDINKFHLRPDWFQNVFLKFFYAFWTVKIPKINR